MLNKTLFCDLADKAEMFAWVMLLKNFLVYRLLQVNSRRVECSGNIRIRTILLLQLTGTLHQAKA